MYKIMQAAIFSLSVHLWKLQNYYQYHDSKSMNYKQEKEVQQMQETYPLCQTKSQFDIMGMFPTFTESMKPWSLTQVDIMDMHIREDTHKKMVSFSGRTTYVPPPPQSLVDHVFFTDRKKVFFLSQWFRGVLPPPPPSGPTNKKKITFFMCVFNL